MEREELSRRLSLHSKTQPLKPHELVSNRREGLVNSESTADACDEYIQQALDSCPYDMYLGLRWYRLDPLPSIISAYEEHEETRLFIDNEFPVHPNVHLEVSSPNKESAKCIPGVITSSNCRDFVTVPKRVPRIKHFMNKAELTDGGWNWDRASTMQNSKCKLFSAASQSIDPRNVLQGKVGNCGFCSGIASLAAGFPEIIKDAFGDNSQLTLSKYGAVSVLMYPRGQPRYLMMDDFILSKNERDCTAYNGRNPPSPSMHSLLSSDAWVRLLEKAFVKVQASYASLDGYYKYNSLYRHPARAMQLLTGAPLALEVHYSISDADIMYKILLSSHGRFAKVVHCRKKFEGLIPSHGYSLLWVGEGGGERWVCLRNPHGQGSYKGRGFNGCNIVEGSDLPNCLKVCNNTNRIVWKQESSECHSALCLRDYNHDNGVFFIDFKTFIECFPITTIVGPIESKSITHTADDSEYDYFALESDKDCVHEVHRRDLIHLCEIVAT